MVVLSLHLRFSRTSASRATSGHKVWRRRTDLFVRYNAPTCFTTAHHRRFADRDQLPKQQQLLTTIAYVSELQRDWACPTADDVAKLFAGHGGSVVMKDIDKALTVEVRNG
jgi:hypothetical protein